MTTIYAVASLLNVAGDQPEALIWKKIGRVFNSAGIELTMLPHLSWHVAMHYDLEALETYLADYTKNIEPITLNFAGIGVFSGSNPVIYLPVTKTPFVSRLHISLWNDLDRFASSVNSNYDPNIWIPHITLSSTESCGDAICQVISELAYTSMYVDFAADNLSIIFKDDTNGGVHKVFRFGKGTE